MDLDKALKFLEDKKDNTESYKSILSKWEKEITFFLSKNIKQKLIIQFLLENDKEIEVRYKSKIENLQVLVSQYCKRLKKQQRSIKNVSSKNQNSSKNEESIKNDSEIISSNIKKSNKDDVVEDTGADLSKKSSIQNFFK